MCYMKRILQDAENVGEVESRGAILGGGRETGTCALSFYLSVSHLTATPKGVDIYITSGKSHSTGVAPRIIFTLGLIGSDLDGFCQRTPCLPFANTQHQSTIQLLLDPYVFLMFSIFFFFFWFFE